MTTGTISLHYVITMREKRNHLYATTWRACTDTSASFNFLTCVVRTLYKKHKAIMKFVISFMAYRSFFQRVPQTVKKITHYVVALHESNIGLKQTSFIEYRSQIHTYASFHKERHIAAYFAYLALSSILYGTQK